jgi:hypothetical protein
MGVAASTALGLLVTSNKDNDTLLVYKFSTTCPRHPVAALPSRPPWGDLPPRPPCSSRSTTRRTTDTGAVQRHCQLAHPPLLLVTDAGNDAVAKVHVAYVAGPGVHHQAPGRGGPWGPGRRHFLEGAVHRRPRGARVRGGRGDLSPPAGHCRRLRVAGGHGRR